MAHVKYERDSNGRQSVYVDGERIRGVTSVNITGQAGRYPFVQVTINADVLELDLQGVDVETVPSTRAD